MRDLLDLVDRAIADASWDTDRLVASAAATGRSRLRRRRAGATLAACAVLGLAGTGLALVGPGDHGAPARGLDPAAGPGRHQVAVPAPTPRATRWSYALGAEQTGQRLADYLQAQGIGQVTDPTSWHEQAGEPAYRGGSVLVGGAKVTVLVDHEVLDRCGEQPRGAACDSTGEGFEAVWRGEEPASGGGPSGIQATTVTLFTPDHFTITATAYNAADEKGVPPLTATPVLSQGVLRTLVESPTWLERRRQVFESRR